jgi:hypothetical protein
MFRFQEFPRDEHGALRGGFKARHSNPGFNLSGFGFRFVDGLTVEEVRGVAAGRIAMVLGDSVTFEPTTREAAQAALEWCERTQPAERVAELRAAVAALFGDAPAETAQHPEEPPQGSQEAPAEQTAPTEPAQPAEPAVEPTEAALAPAEPAAAAEPVAVPPKPTTRADLDALSDEQIKALAFEMALRDKRWGVAKLRDLIAQECDL